ncbi:uncharacterized protein LOC116617004 [Nematostella vectensis]|uniref:uncharacterized protein LOC116617004 n=1 Tax=Nematostella vectensis TaxID=45351 RepID=UPI0020777FDD|nr:uncharacterized protein LOC116617004 [Nematostella vectensis]XP_032235225.2 uncharacterized protein LOC116617004 [Nematostella vectensis]XP_032235226.2 uncharacterized protein LOC116617004 [Nematostella vectensis]
MSGIESLNAKTSKDQKENIYHSLENHRDKIDPMLGIGPILQTGTSRHGQRGTVTTQHVTRQPLVGRATGQWGRGGLGEAPRDGPSTGCQGYASRVNYVEERGRPMSATPAPDHNSRIESVWSPQPVILEQVEDKGNWRRARTLHGVLRTERGDMVPPLSDRRPEPHAIRRRTGYKLYPSRTEVARSDNSIVTRVAQHYINVPIPGKRPGQNAFRPQTDNKPWPKSCTENAPYENSIDAKTVQDNIKVMVKDLDRAGGVQTTSYASGYQGRERSIPSINSRGCGIKTDGQKVEVGRGTGPPCTTEHSIKTRVSDATSNNILEVKVDVRKPILLHVSLSEDHELTEKELKYERKARRRLMRSLSIPHSKVSSADELCSPKDGTVRMDSPQGKNKVEDASDDIRVSDSNGLKVPRAQQLRSKSLPVNAVHSLQRLRRKPSSEMFPLRYFAYLGRRFQPRGRLPSTQDIHTARPIILTSTSVVSPDASDGIRTQINQLQPGFETTQKANDWTECVECATCVCCVKGAIYHCTKDTETEGEMADQPCACEGPYCFIRWTILGALSLCLPCLCLYLPLQGCRKCMQHARGRGRYYKDIELESYLASPGQ